MKTLKVAVKEAQEVLNLRGVVESYEEIAAMRMQRIRGDIINSREFYEGLTRLSKEVGVDFNLAYPDFNKKTAAIYISANAGLYGDIIEKTFFPFLNYIKKNTCDAYIVGRRGDELMREHFPGHKYFSFDLSDDRVEEEKFRDLITSILTYKNIIVFYGKFKNVVNQEPVQTVISGELLMNEGSKEEEKKKMLKFLYEPSLLEISKIIGTEILASIFEAMLRESQLAKYASRLMYLDSSLDKIEDSIRQLNIEKRKIRKASLDKKQRLVVSGIISRGY